MSEQNSSVPKTIFRKDYSVPEFLIPQVYLEFILANDYTLVNSKLSITKNKASEKSSPKLVLNAQKMEIVSVSLDAVAAQWTFENDLLEIFNVPDECIVEISNKILPQDNKSLEGLYKSSHMFCTQCEPEGFRGITPFVDRPDVMSSYTVKIIANKKNYPILLSNGNPIESGDMDSGKHFVTWQDPFAKPCYLFALVAGDLAYVSDNFKTKSNRDVALKIYVDKGNEDRCDWAMDSLKRSMAWDEEVFDLEYDLDIFNIVAVDDFNFGAMENKSLNIFNSAAVLANAATATDANFERIEGIVAHEYFHNWTGNRVTCRDWFQLTLKEGLTVFRDNEFSSDMNSRAVYRINTVRSLKDRQFVEDSGPMAHAIRPDSYIEINNFYTATVYEKGAEVIRMVHTLIGADAFRKGINRYFELFDGQAVTCDDFLQAMAEASGYDFTQFKNWYSHSGTPEVSATGNWNNDEYTLKITQNSNPPFQFPLVVGLVNKKGDDIFAQKTLVISEAEQSFVFENVTEEVIASINRGFSAPIKLTTNLSEEELYFLFANDNDPFNQFETGQQLANNCLNKLISQYQNNQEFTVDTRFVNAVAQVLSNDSLDPSFRAEMLSLPSITTLTENMDICDFDAANEAQDFLRLTIANAHKDIFKKYYHNMTDNEYQINATAFGRRYLKGSCLSYLMTIDDAEAQQLCTRQFSSANNMTDKITALNLLCNSYSTERQIALDSFYEKWKDDPLVMNKWFTVQAFSKREDTLETVKKLAYDPAFDAQNPNKVRALFGSFSSGNLRRFHTISGEGYRYIADKILEIDNFNPSVASGLSGSFKKCAKLDDIRKPLMITELKRILAKEGLSSDVYEIVSKTLTSAEKTLGA